MATLHPEPPFALCGPRGTLIARGVRTRYCDVRAAQAALRSGTAPILLGALPFDVSRPAALMVPDGVLRARKLPDWPTGPLPKVRVAAALPPPADYLTRIGRARDLLAAFDGPLHKVVLARAVQLTADAPLDARVLLRRLVVADPTAYGYLVDLTSAGNDDTGAALVGASPELLVARSGNRVMCKPFAGSAPRAADPKLDAANAAALASSAKNRHEHQLVVDTMRVALEPLCEDLTIPAQPQLNRTAAVWHLCTAITGRLRNISTTAIDLALALHPTPAVGGSRQKLPPSSSPNSRATVASTPARLVGATAGATAIGWCLSGARNFRLIDAQPLRTLAVASSPNQTPMTNLKKPQRSSPRY